MQTTLRRRAPPVVTLTLIALALAVGAQSPGVGGSSESGYDLWLRYRPVTDPALRASYGRFASAIVVPSRSPTGDVLAGELTRGLGGLLGIDVPRVDHARAAGAVIAGTPATSPLVAALGWTAALARLDDEVEIRHQGRHCARRVRHVGE